jgi:hypothetical protein
VPSAVSADQTSGLSVPADRLPPMSNTAPWAVTAGNKCREVARSTENPTTKLLAGIDGTGRSRERAGSRNSAAYDNSLPAY